ncbi:MAG: ABC transporter ATP-binding protein [Myxococcota bacterium]
MSDASTSPPVRGFGGLFALVRTRPWLLGSACLCAALASAAGMGPYVAVYGIALEVLQPTPEVDAVWTYAWIGVGLTALKFALMMGSHALAHAGAFGILYDLRVRLARKMARVPLGFFDRTQTGALHKAMTDDVSGLEAFLAHMLPDGAAALTVPLAALAVMLPVDWRMTLAAVAAVPFAVAAQVFMLRRDHKDAYEEHHAATEATKLAVVEYLRGMHVVKAFGLEARGFDRLDAAVARMTNYVEDYANNAAPPMVATMKLLCGGTNALFIVPVGLWFLAEGTLEPAVLVFFLLVGTQILSPFLRIANVMGNLQRLLKGADNIATILDADELDTVTSEDTLEESEPPRITFDAVEFAYDDRPALDGLSFTAPAGGVTALVGPSGSGKSTVLRLIARLWDVDAGRIRLADDDIRKTPLDDHLGRVSIVFQDVFLFHGSIADNLRIAAPNCTDAALVEACRIARIHDAIEAMPEGYATVVGDRGLRLSGGERQRLSIARAVLKDAPVLLLDEATAFADAENEALIHAALAEVAKRRTVVVVAHRLATIANADHIVVLDRGAAVDAGTHDALRGRCLLYQQLWSNYEAAHGWTLGAAR